jgi:light-regulated signal transduction histidine kinase (bacteriophytochrome)
LKVSDQDKTTFITLHDIYCYMAMTFGLRNAGATYQKAIQECLECQIHKDVEAYVDDVVVKTTAEDDLIAVLAETFANLRHYRWKLNPEKCVFDVQSDKLLGFMVSHRGIEANPTKVDTIRKMKRPTGKKDVMKLTGMMAAIGRFIRKLGEKGVVRNRMLVSLRGGGGELGN